jgi:hypothetical protein
VLVCCAWPVLSKTSAFNARRLSIIFLSYECIVVFLDGYHPVDLKAQKVGDVKDCLIANGVVEPLDAEVDIYDGSCHIYGSFA